MMIFRTAVHHPVRVNERESPGELLCEGANLVFSEALAIALIETRMLGSGWTGSGKRRFEDGRMVRDDYGCRKR